MSQESRDAAALLPMTCAECDRPKSHARWCGTAARERMRVVQARRVAAMAERRAALAALLDARGTR